jgi:hypothetical protein
MHGNISSRRRGQSLTGLRVELPDACRCASNVAVVCGDKTLLCRSCGRRRGRLTQFTASWIAHIAAKWGAPEIITIRGPRL